MKNLSINRLLFIIAMVLAFVAVMAYVQSDAWAIVLMCCILLLVFINSRIARRNERVAMRGLSKKNSKKIPATIIERSILGKHMVLQLEVYHPQKTFITGYVVDNFTNEFRERFKKGSEIFVFVNPEKPDTVAIENVRPTPVTNPNRRKTFWEIIVAVISVVIPIIIPVIITFTDTSDRIFQDVGFIGADPQRPLVVDVRFQKYKNVHLFVYDPVTGRRITHVKDKKSKSDGYSTLYFFPLNDDFVIVGNGKAPIFDVYDGVTFKKKSSIAQLEMQYDILSSGIAKIDIKYSNAKITKDYLLSLLTISGDECYFALPEGHLLVNYKQMEQYIKAKDSIIVAKTLNVFCFAPDPNNSRKKRLYQIGCNNHKAIPELLYHAGIENLNVQYFNNQRNYAYRNLSAPRLLTKEYFLEARFVYMESNFVVISCLQSMADDANEQLIGIDNNGKVLFRLSENQYPNADKMAEDGYKPRNNRKLKFYKYNNQMVILFDKYGALSVGLNGEGILWTLAL